MVRLKIRAIFGVALLLVAGVTLYCLHLAANDASKIHNKADIISSFKNVKRNQLDYNNQQSIEHHNNNINLDISDFDRLQAIGKILGFDNAVRNNTAQDKIERIEEVISAFRGKGDIMANAGDILQQIAKIVAFSDGNNAAPAADGGSSAEKLKILQQSQGQENVLIRIESLLEPPPPDVPPIPKAKLGDMDYLTRPDYRPTQCKKDPLSHRVMTSTWFRERYVPNIKLFLDKEDTNNFKNFYKLQHYGPPFGYKNINRTLLGLLTNHPNYTVSNSVFGSQGRPECVSCAVVGCGGVLNGSGMGQEIDSHDYVFRLNHALTKDRFAKDVGSRTSFYTFFPESNHVHEVQDKIEAMFFYVPFKTYDIEYGYHLVLNIDPPLITRKGKPRKMRKPPLDPQRVRIIHPDFLRYVFGKYLDGKAYRPTTGAMVALLAIHMCDSVDMYGFGYDHHFTLHYYDSKFVVHTDKSTSTHDVDNERELWHTLRKWNIITLYNRTTV